MNVIEIKDLVKSYGSRKVLHGISFEVKKGEIFALLGTNGAGKTTTLECIEGLRQPDSGDIKIAGKIGVQLQSASLPPSIKAKEAIEMFRSWNGYRDLSGLAQRLGVSEFQDRQYKQLSTGQKRRLHLVLAMAQDPDILFLDEPTAGLDVEGRVLLHEEIKMLKQAGKTLLLASHDMAEIEELCDRIAILKDGRFAFMGTPAELIQTVEPISKLRIRFSDKITMDQLAHGRHIGQTGKETIFESDNVTAFLKEIADTALNQHKVIHDIRIEYASMEQRFMDIAREDQI